jgi:hypothetical protein
MSIVGGSRAKTRSIQSRARGPAREALDLEWLRKHERGKTAAEIAEAEGVSKRTVQLALARARAAEEGVDRAKAGDPELPIRDETATPRPPWWLELVPLFPIGAFTPTSKCPHHGPIRPGSLFCCMVCSNSGVDDHPFLKRNPKTDPLPEPLPRPSPASLPVPPAAPASRLDEAARRQTRKERRRRRSNAAQVGRGA